MKAKIEIGRWGRGALRLAILAAIVAALLLSGELAGFYYGSGLLFVLIGGLASIFMGFPLRTIGSALKHALGKPGDENEIKTSIYFWEAFCRNLVIVGALGSLIHFIIQMMSGSEGIAYFFSMFAHSFLSTLYGLILGAICIIPAFKLKKDLASQSTQAVTPVPQKATAGSRLGFSQLAAYVVFTAFLGWTMLTAPADERWSTVDWFIHLPAILVVLGGTLAISLFIGRAADGETITVGFAFTGLIGSLMGLVQTLHGMTEGSIQSIASAVAFIMSSCFLALTGIVLIGAPLEDRSFEAVKDFGRQKISRIAWYGFPLIAIIFLIFCLIIIVTPMKK